MMEACHFKMPAEMARQMIEIARERDVSVGQILRDLIAQEIERAAQGRSPLTPEQRRFEALRVDLLPDVQASENWPALQARLRAKGYEMRLDGDVLALHSYPKGHRTCLASDIGLAHGDLARRMGAAFPGHRDRAGAPDGPYGAPPLDGPQSYSAQSYAPQHHAPQSHAPQPYPPHPYPAQPYAPETGPFPGQHVAQQTAEQLAMPDPGPHVNHGPAARTAPNGLHLSEPARATTPPSGNGMGGADSPHANTPQANTPQANTPQQAKPTRPPAAQPARTERSDPRLPPSWLTAARTAAE